MTDNSKNFDSLQEINQQVLNNISQLQTQERELYKSLDDISLSTEQKKNIIKQINEISQIRINLYASLKDMFSFYKGNVGASRTTLGQSIVAIDVLENELNQSKMRLNQIEEQKYNKLRLVENNTYFGKRYNAYSTLMKIIVITCIPIIILTVLENKGILPPNIYKLLSIIILVIGTVMIGLKLIDIFNRDSMNWDEYDWYFDKTNAPSHNTSTDMYVSINPWSTPSITCIGSDCCYDGSTYDSKNNICVPNDIYNKEYSDDTSNTFQGLEKYAYGQMKMTPLNNYVSPISSTFNF
jgi:hypothetical protein